MQSHTRSVITAHPSQRRRPLVLIMLASLVGLLLASFPTASATTTAVTTTVAEPSGEVIRVGTEGTYPPFSYRDGELKGYDIEVMNAVAEELGWDIQYVESPWDAIFPALDAGRIDTVANQVTVTAEREESYVFSEPYTYSRGVIVTRSDDDSITTLEDLEGKVAAQSPTSNWTVVARDAGAQIEGVEQFSQAVELLVQGRVDVIVNDNIAVLDYIETTGSEDIKIAGNAGDETSEQAFVFRPEDRALAQQATTALQALKADGTIAEISESYFGADISSPDGGDATVQGRERRSSLEVAQQMALPMLKALVTATIPLTFISFALGLILAVGVALARLSDSALLRAPARAFVSAIRGTPLLVQLFIIFYGLPQLGLNFNPWPAAILAFTLNVAGYAAEIVRAAILSVPKGQTEAAATVGMSYAQTMRRVVLPQAARVAVPPLSNTFISLVKDTSLAAVVLVTEMFRVAQIEAAQTFRFMELYGMAAIYYWVVCTALSAVQDRLETRLGRHVAK